LLRRGAAPTKTPGIVTHLEEMSTVMEARFWTIGEVRQSVLELVRKYYDYETASACGRLIDELVAWSRAKGLVEKKHFGKSPVMKFAPAEGMNEAWAIYCEHRQGAGPKLSLVPGRRDHGLELREIVERLCGPPEGGWDGKMNRTGFVGDLLT